MLIWYVAGAVAAIAVGWLASLVHASGSSPIGLVSVGVGVSLSAILWAIAVSQRLAGFRRLILSTVLLAFLTVLAEHTWLYLDFCRQWRESRAKSPQVAVFRDEAPPSLREYFANEWSSETAAIWSLDATLIVASAVVTVRLLNPNKNSEP